MAVGTVGALAVDARILLGVPALLGDWPNRLALVGTGAPAVDTVNDGLW